MIRTAQGTLLGSLSGKTDLISGISGPVDISVERVVRMGGTLNNFAIFLVL